MYHVIAVNDRQDALRVARVGLLKSCDSPYEFFLSVDRDRKLVVVSRDNGDEGVIRKAVPFWSLRYRYSEVGGLLRILKLSDLFVRDNRTRRLLVRRDVVSAEIDERMSRVRDELASWVYNSVCRNV